MITATRSRLLLSTGLMTLVSFAGCQTQKKCQSCQHSYDTIHVMPHEMYPYSQELYGYGQEYGTPVEEYAEPVPAETREPAPVPIPDTSGSKSTFPPPPAGQQVTPPTPGDSTTGFHLIEPQQQVRLQSMNPKEQFQQSRIIYRSQPERKADVTKSAEPPRGLLRKSIRPPRVLQPIGAKMRSMFEAVKDRIPTASASSNRRGIRGRTGKSSRNRPAARIAKRRTQPTRVITNKQIAMTPAVTLLAPQFHIPQPTQKLQMAKHNRRPITQTQMITPTQQQQNLWETRIPRQNTGPSLGAYSQSPLKVNRPTAAGPLEKWPYARAFSN